MSVKNTGFYPVVDVVRSYNLTVETADPAVGVAELDACVRVAAGVMARTLNTEGLYQLRITVTDAEHNVIIEHEQQGKPGTFPSSD